MAKQLSVNDVILRNSTKPRNKIKSCGAIFVFIEDLLVLNFLVPFFYSLSSEVQIVQVFESKYYRNMFFYAVRDNTNTYQPNDLIMSWFGYDNI